MTYHDQTVAAQPRQIRVSASSSNNRRLPSRLQPIRIVCQASERHFPPASSSPYTIDSSVKPIRLNMSNIQEPIQYRSEVVVNNKPHTNLHIKRLRVAWRYDDNFSMGTAPQHHRSSSSSSLSARSQSAHVPRFETKGTDSTSKRRSATMPRSRSQALLHKWIDDICANEQLMADNDIVFFLKNGEFYARI